MTNPTTTPAPSQDFARIVELLQEFTATDTQLQRVDADINTAVQHGAQVYAADYVILQERRAAVEQEVKTIFARNPGWLVKGEKTIKTPYGSISTRDVPSLKIHNEEATLALIDQRAKTDAKFDPSIYTRTVREVNKDTLATLPDDELSRLGVARITTEIVTVKPAKVDATKVVKAAKAKEAQPA